MPFDQDKVYSPPISFVVDRAAGRYAEADRFDVTLTDVAEAITELRRLLDDVQDAAAPDLAGYYTKTQLDALLAAKQAVLGFVPINAATKGAANGVAPLGADGRVPAANLPPTSGGSAITSFMGRSDANAVITDADVAAALGYVPPPTGHGHTIGQVTGLQAALDGKQNVLGYTPAPEAHTHAIADVTGLAAQLAGLAGFSTTDVALATSLPVGSVVLVDTTGATIGKRSNVIIYVGTLSTSAYNTAASGSALAGTWRSCGGVGVVAIFQRVA